MYIDISSFCVKGYSKALNKYFIVNRWKFDLFALSSPIFYSIYFTVGILGVS